MRCDELQCGWYVAVISPVLAVGCHFWCRFGGSGRSNSGGNGGRANSVVSVVPLGRGPVDPAVGVLLVLWILELALLLVVPWVCLLGMVTVLVLIIWMSELTQGMPVAVAGLMCCLMWGIDGSGLGETMAYAVSMSMCFWVLPLYGSIWLVEKTVGQCDWTASSCCLHPRHLP